MVGAAITWVAQNKTQSPAQKTIDLFMMHSNRARWSLRIFRPSDNTDSNCCAGRVNKIVASGKKNIFGGDSSSKYPVRGATRGDGGRHTEHPPPPAAPRPATGGDTPKDGSTPDDLDQQALRVLVQNAATRMARGLCGQAPVARPVDHQVVEAVMVGHG
jgi:hypothetical protein